MNTSLVRQGREPQSEQLKTMLELYVENGGDHKQAYLDAGYAPSASKKAMRMVRENWEYVEKLIMARIGGSVPFAVEGIVNLAKTAKSESVRLKALQDLLSRAGYDGVIKIETKEMATEEMTDEAIEQELLALIRESGFETTEQDNDIAH